MMSPQVTLETPKTDVKDSETWGLIIDEPGSREVFNSVLSCKVFNFLVSGFTIISGL